MRPRCRRRLGHNFKDLYFKPRGTPLRGLKEVVISYEEMETMRLRYTDGLSQEEAAKKMGISQSQYQRDLTGALKKVTEALVSGFAIRVEG